MHFDTLFFIIIIIIIIDIFIITDIDIDYYHYIAITFIIIIITPLFLSLLEYILQPLLLHCLTWLFLISLL